MLKKSLLVFVLGLVVHLYTTFVLTVLWNWFVTTSFHVGEISFWVMYGLVLVVNLFQNPGDKNFGDERRWSSLMIAIDACVPENRKDFVKEQLEEQKSAMWLEIGTTLVGRVFGNTVTLGVGFVVHILASA